MTILEQRGFFWWHDELVPNHRLAPDSYVAGLCRIEDDGRTVLELDGCLPNAHGPMAAMIGGPVTRCIQGLLKESKDRVLLSSLARFGGQFSTNGMSFEKFVAMDCLVGSGIFHNGAQAPEFDTLEIPLSGFEEWLRLGTIEVSYAGGNISARYEKPNGLTYAYDRGILKIAFEVHADESGIPGTYAFSLKQSALLQLHLSSACALRDLRMQYGTVEDLFKLLTGSDYALDWPRVSLGGGPKCLWYFTRLKNKEPITTPEHYNTITSFSEIQGKFGSIWSAWNAKREEFGTGFYLYFGTRRGLGRVVN